jgi:hypothetical protein
MRNVSPVLDADDLVRAPMIAPHGSTDASPSTTTQARMPGRMVRSSTMIRPATSMTMRVISAVAET